MKHIVRVVSTAVVATALCIGILASPAAAYTLVNGAGSTWSSVALQQWQADIAKRGVPVNYQALGSTAGRQDYIQGTVDFGVSEIPFQPASKARDGSTLYDERAQAAKRPYAYLPIVAGGTSFMYHLEVNHRRVNDLRLSGRTIARIFTGGITNWDDAAITKDDGRHFPNLPITPVVRSDGSGTSAQFSAYLATMFPDIWNPFCKKYANIDPPCPLQSLYPYFANSKAQALSDGVASFVAAPYNNGSITYVEYAYAKERSFPVVSVENQAGYFTQPTASNVAIALETAQINADRTQVLSKVYTNPDKRAYPISSYSYMIVPTTTANPMTTAKGATLGEFILYFTCTGQQKAEILGYSPLPKNLVRYAWDAESLIPGARKPPAQLNYSTCANPTVAPNYNVNAAPPPPPSAQAGSTPPPLPGGPTNQNNNGGAITQGNTGGNTSTGGNTDTSTTTTPSGSSTGKSKNTTSGTGQTTDTTVGSQNVAAQNISVQRHADSVPTAVYVFAALVVLLAIFLPPAIGITMKRRSTAGRPPA